MLRLVATLQLSERILYKFRSQVEATKSAALAGNEALVGFVKRQVCPAMKLGSSELSVCLGGIKLARGVAVGAGTVQ